MSRYIVPAIIIAALVALIMLGGSALVWQASLSSETLTPAQMRLLDVAEWMLKGAFLSLLGFLVGLGMNIHKD